MEVAIPNIYITVSKNQNKQTTRDCGLFESIQKFDFFFTYDDDVDYDHHHYDHRYYKNKTKKSIEVLSISRL